MPRVSDNDNLELKKRSRRRLVGAAALALVAAIVLPMVMDSEPATSVHDIQVSIPERGLDSNPVSVLPETLPPLPVDIPEVPDSAAPEVEQAVRPIEPAPVPAPEPPAAAAAKDPKPKAAPRPQAEEPAPAPAQTVAPDDTSDRAATSDDGERAKAILEGRASTPPASGDEFVVQVGAFSDADKAASHQIELAARGFKSYIERAEGVSRVRMGPFSSRSDAEAMVRRLKNASLDGVVSTR